MPCPLDCQSQNTQQACLCGRQLQPPDQAGGNVQQGTDLNQDAGVEAAAITFIDHRLGLGNTRTKLQICRIEPSIPLDLGIGIQLWLRSSSVKALGHLHQQPSPPSPSPPGAMEKSSRQTPKRDQPELQDDPTTKKTLTYTMLDQLGRWPNPPLGRHRQQTAGIGGRGVREGRVYCSTRWGKGKISLLSSSPMEPPRLSSLAQRSVHCNIAKL